jgi:hypothetical protein
MYADMDTANMGSLADRMGSVGKKLPWTSHAKTGMDNLAEKIGKVCEQ